MFTGRRPAYDYMTHLQNAEMTGGENANAIATSVRGGETATEMVGVSNTPKARYP